MARPAGPRRGDSESEPDLFAQDPRADDETYFAQTPRVEEENFDDLFAERTLQVVEEEALAYRDEDDEPRKARGTLLMLAALIGLAVAGAAVWVMVSGGRPAQGPVAAPTVPASPDPYKVRPADPGGMQVPNQDKLVYDRLKPGEPAPGAPQVERLLPEPARPQAPPEAPAAPPAAAQTPATPAVPALPSVSAPPSVAAAPTPAAPTPAAPTLAAPASPPPVTTPPQALAPQADPSKAASTPEAAKAVEPAKPAAPLKLTPPEPGARPGTVPGTAPGTAAPGMAAPTPPAAAVAVAPAAPVAKAPANPPATAPATVKGSGYQVQFASMRDEATARRTWEDLKARNPDLLGSLTLVVEKTEIEGKGMFYRVRAGGLASESAARTLCAEMAKRKVGCFFVGK